MIKMTQAFQKVAAIRGMNDLLPGPSARWEQFEEIVRGWLRGYGYRNVRTPVLEHTRLFTRGIGEVTDIVEKEMYTFTDALNGESLTMRPEMTAGIVRAAHRAALIAHLEKHSDILDEDGKRRLYTNPLRVLDTKNPAMQEMADSAPRLFDFLGEESRAHFDGVCQRLTDAGIEYRLNPRLVRGLDYYNLTVFEWVTDRLGSQGTVCGGGRYDGLIELLGGKAAPAVGFAIGMERLLDLWEQSVQVEAPAECDVYVVHQGEDAQRLAARVGEDLRDAGLSVVVHAGAASFKSQFKRADASGARVAVILGADEVASQTASIKFLRADAQGDGAQQQVPLAGLADVLKNLKG